jgi:hypothetical protein
MSACTEQFGFLNYPKSMSFAGGRIEPVDDFEDRLAYVLEIACKDGYIYPPQIYEVEHDDAMHQGSIKVRNSERPAHVYELPMSHVLYLNNPLETENVRFGDAGLIVHLSGFFFGLRLQLSGWKFDGRVPAKSDSSFTYSEDVPSSFVSYAYQRWRCWDDALRKRMTNILYMHCKASSMYWSCEAFAYHYMVFDALYKCYVLLGNKPIGGHDNRFAGLCAHYGIPVDSVEIAKMHRLRNDMFHEALWDGEMPGYKHSDAFYTAKWLRRLNARIIVATFGYRNAFVNSGWSYFGWQLFDKFE